MGDRLPLLPLPLPLPSLPLLMLLLVLLLRLALLSCADGRADRSGRQLGRQLQ